MLRGSNRVFCHFFLFPRQEKEAYIRAKYVERKFVDKYSALLSPSEQEKRIISKSCEDQRLSHARASVHTPVKSNDSGIQQCSEDGRESLPSTVSANSLYEPGES